VLSYYVTNRRQFAGTEAKRRARLLQTIRKACAAGVDYIQLGEKDLAIRELEKLAMEALRVIRGEGAARLLIHHRTDVALAVQADGVHLADKDIAASEARALAAKVCTRRFLIAVSCHSTQEVRLAESHGADFAVLAPIFETERLALEELREAAQKDRSPDLRVEAGDTRRRFSVFAQGGVNLERATVCADAGAAGIAGTRLFQECEDLKGLIIALGAL
jgi:thiamine-phosphate pyrophosphorylase